MSTTTESNAISQQATATTGAGTGLLDHAELDQRIQDFEDAWSSAGGGTLRSPSLGGTSTTWYLGAMLDDIQARRAALGLPEYSPPTYKPLMMVTPFGKQATEPTLSSTTLEDMLRECRQPSRIVQPSQLIATYGTATSTTTAAPSFTPVDPVATATSNTIPPGPALRRVNAFGMGFYTGPTDEDDLMDRLRHWRSELQLRQDDLYRGCDTAEQIAAAEAESRKIDRKVSAIEDLMLTCGAIFRHR